MIEPTPVGTDLLNPPAPFRHLLRAFARNESGALGDFLRGDAHVHLSGAGDLPGEYEGHTAVRAWMRRRQAALANRRYDARVLSTSESRSHVSAQVEVQAEADGLRFQWRCVWVCLLGSGQVIALGLYVEDDTREAFNRFWARAIA